jgi:hypothetical protein
MTTPEEIAYNESVRALEQQARALDEIRSRTGILVAGSALVGSVLGAETLGRGSTGTAAVLALVALGGVLVLSLYVLLPRNGWKWTASARDALWWARPDVENAILAMHAFLAVVMEDSWDGNRKRLDRLLAAYQLAIGCLGAELLFWTLELTERG